MLTQSLDICLRHLRDPMHSKTYWIDQICINQQDKAEKTTQVQLLGGVFSNADHVVAWLGPAHNLSDELMSRWDHVGHEAISWGIEDVAKGSDAPFAAKILDESKIPPALRAGFLQLLQSAYALFRSLAPGIKKLFARPLFSRVWVIQEVCLGKSVIFQCGYQRVDIRALYWGMMISTVCFVLPLRTALLAGSKPPPDILDFGTGRTPLAALMGCWQGMPVPSAQSVQVRKGRRLYGYLTWLNLTRRTYSSDPRDMIYGILALPTDLASLNIKPDYNLDSETVYINTTNVILHRGDGFNGPTLEPLTIICSDPTGGTKLNLPTWVPNWLRELRHCFADLSRAGAQEALFHAGGNGMLPSFVDSTPPSTRVLGLKGIIVGRIQEVGRTWRGGPSNTEFFTKMMTAESTENKHMLVVRHQAQVHVNLLEDVAALYVVNCLHFLPNQIR
jgi:hypothetical protein